MLDLKYEGLFLNYFTTEHEYEFVSRKDIPYRDGNIKADAVTIIAKTKGGLIVLITEYRPALGRHILSFPAGLIDEGETAEEAAIREFKEETGLELENVVTITETGFTSAGLTDEQNAIVIGVVDTDKKDVGELGIKVGYYTHQSLITLSTHGAVSAKVASFTAALLMTGQIQ